MNFLNEELIAKWKPVLEHPDLAKITDTHKRNVTAVILENTEKAIREQQSFNPQSLMETSPTNSAGTGGYAGAGGTSVAGYDPILISLVRRAMPNLIAYDIAGVQPMSGPTGLIFAMKSKYTSQGGTEALFNEANSGFSGVTTQAGDSSSLPSVTGGSGADVVAALSLLPPPATDRSSILFTKSDIFS